MLGLPVYLVFWILYKPDGITVHALWFPWIVLTQLLFTLGLAFFVAALAVHFRDIRDLLTNILTLWFFASPVLYRPTFVDQGSILRLFLDLNPMTHIMEAYHLAIFDGAMIPWRRLGVTTAVALGVFVAGYFFFDRLRDSFPEEV